ncbi:hypothetical protein LWI28_011346 [Acer negundo]|uniref:Uncharacterized protein n=1 Tax=Acer negundo TaxID=4023 RepID=A0AAD5NGB8_ACENE|nr:hypothetical protein LWI28_011346 [Acer negundo]KAK4835043.1 hypothetical protein QYF36_004450 [Acer negundo]KAK4836470.1 hypothetical protein QYF36_023542 [Acer negundo]
MAVSAFKSSSRRGTTPLNYSSTTTTTSDKESKHDSSKSRAPPPRRSRSVSAFSRTHLDISSNDFLIKRDNPLFSTTNDSMHETTTKLHESTTKLKASSVEEDTSRRGRSVSRNAPVSGIGRSLSRVDTGRRGRSVSRCPVSRGQSVNCESEVEQEDRKSINGSAANLSCTITGSSAEAEEKTIKAVCEQVKTFQGDNLESDASGRSIYETVRSEVRRAISDIENDLQSAMGRSNTTAIATASVTDISPDLVSPAAVELVLDIRREYAKKLEQSQERAARLRADLNVEEHRGLELSRILKEVLPDPNTPNVQKSRPGRKSSIERRKMSKRLTDEAMSYFDECVSLSTFDSSDFSSPEDPLLSSLGVATPAVASVSLPHASSSVSASYSPDNCLNDKQDCWFTHSQDALELTASSCSKEHTQDQVRLFSADKVWGRRFSFDCKPSENFDFQQDIMKYVKNFEKDADKVNIDPKIITSNHYDLDDYSLQASPQSLLFDRVFLKNRLESGSLLLCSGGIAISSSPFASII